MATKLKWVKGHNGQRRKLARAVARMEVEYDVFNMPERYLWAIYSPVHSIAWGFKQRHEWGADLYDRAMELLNNAWWRENMANQMSEWDLSVL